MKKISFILAMILLFNISVVAFAEHKTNFFMFELESDEVKILSGFDIIDDENASGGKAIIATIGNTNTPPADLLDVPVSYTFDATQSGTYTVYLRARTAKESDQSFFLAMNNSGYTYNVTEGKEYVWLRVNYKIEEGLNTFKIHYRKAGVVIDKVIITNALGYAPVDMGSAPKGDLYTPKDYNNGEELYANIPLPSFVPKAEHPRVLVNKEDIPKIKQNFSCIETKNAYERVLSASELEPSICILPELKEGGTSNYSVTPLSYIESNALLYLVNGDEIAGRKAVDGMIAYYRTLDMSGSSLMNISRQGGLVVLVSAEVYDWCYPLLSDEEKKEILEKGLVLTQASEFGYPPKMAELAYNIGHSSESDFMKFQLAFAIAIYDEYPDLYNIVGGRILNEFVPTKNYIYKDSLSDPTGSYYGGSRSLYEFFMPLLLDKMGAPNLVSEEFQNKFIGMIYHRLPSGGYFKNGDDTPLYNGFNTIFKSATYLAANYYKNPYLKEEYYRNLTDGRNSGWDVNVATPVHQLIFEDPSVKAKSIKGFPLSAFMGVNQGITVARTGWNDGLTSPDMLVFMKLPQNFYKSHEHYDAGSFQIYYKGMLALDSGRYATFGSEHDYGYYKQTIAHNSMLIYNPDKERVYYKGDHLLHGGQSNNILPEYIRTLNDMKEKTRIGTHLGYDYGGDSIAPHYTYSKGDLTNAYSGDCEKFTRTFTFLNLFDDKIPGALIVFDKVIAGEEFEKIWLLHTSNEPEVNGNVQTAVRTDSGNSGRLINETLLPKNPKIEKIGGPGKEFFVSGVNKTSSVDHLYDYGNWRLEISPKTKQKTDYFINVLQVSDASEDIEPLKSKLYETEKYYGVEIKDRVVYLSKNETRTSKNVTISSDKSEYNEKTYMVDGLKAGTWSVLKDGKEITKAIVSEKGGTLTFNGGYGEYTLKYYSNKTEKKKWVAFDWFGEDKENYIKLKYNNILYDLKTPPIDIEGIVYFPIDNYVELCNGTFEILSDNEVKINYVGKEYILNTNDGLLKTDNGFYVNADKLASVFNFEYKYTPFASLINVDAQAFVYAKDMNIPSDTTIIKLNMAYSNFSGLENIFDLNLSSAFTVEGEGKEIYFVFENEEVLKDVQIKWAQGDTRQAYYDVLTSQNGENYTSIFSGSSSGLTADFDSTDFAPVKAKYVKIVLNGNSKNAWNNIYEIRFIK